MPFLAQLLQEADTRDTAHRHVGQELLALLGRMGTRDRMLRYPVGPLQARPGAAPGVDGCTCGALQPASKSYPTMCCAPQAMAVGHARSTLAHRLHSLALCHVEALPAVCWQGLALASQLTQLTVLGVPHEITGGWQP